MHYRGKHIRIGIVDNDALVLGALQYVMRTCLPQSEVIWEETDGNRAVSLCSTPATTPDALIVDASLEGMTGSKFLLEPVGRNTAPAIALACLTMDPETIVLVSPSDHVIRKKDEYKKVLLRAQELAEAGNLVTFGITPTSPETGYGYIEAAGEDVKRFVEKPDLATAEKYLLSGNFYWNSGIFCFKAKTKAALDKALVEEGEPIRIDRDDMLAIPSNSIDYAVMEKSNKVKVVPSDIGWSDLGSFDSLYNEYPHDDNGNNVNPRHIAVGSKNSLVMGSQRAIATIDLDKMLTVTRICHIIDRAIHENYKIFKTNYIAHDILFDNKDFADKYTAEEKEAFTNYLTSQIDKTDIKLSEFDRFYMYTKMLQMYSNPLTNQLEALK